MNVFEKQLLRLQVTGMSELSDPEIRQLHDDYADANGEFAEGTGIFVTPRLFNVEVHYLVPGPDSDTVNTWYHDVSASSPEMARRMAESEFRLLESLSAVGWEREIVTIEVYEG